MIYLRVRAGNPLGVTALTRKRNETGIFMICMNTGPMPSRLRAFELSIDGLIVQGHGYQRIVFHVAAKRRRSRCNGRRRSPQHPSYRLTTSQGICPVAFGGVSGILLARKRISYTKQIGACAVRREGAAPWCGDVVGDCGNLGAGTSGTQLNAHIPWCNRPVRRQLILFPT